MKLENSASRRLPMGAVSEISPMSRALRILILILPLALTACGRPTLPCNTPTPITGSATNEFRYSTTRAAAEAAAAAGVPAAAVVEAKGSFRCPTECPFQTATGVTSKITGTSSSYSFIGSFAELFRVSNYIGYADYTWTASGACAVRAPLG